MNNLSKVLVAPDIVATVLNETLPPDLILFALAVDPPALWDQQRGGLECQSKP